MKEKKLEKQSNERIIKKLKNSERKIAREEVMRVRSVKLVLGC